MKCKLCPTEFTPPEGQLPAQWAVLWNKGRSGLLCPNHHEVAKKFNCVSEKPLPLRVVPWASEILEGKKHDHTIVLEGDVRGELMNLFRM